jgi:sigma-E factor negative regulatory protein RseC
MSEFSLVEHTGYIEKVLSGHIQVRIINESACASCHAKGACNASDMKEKIIDVDAVGYFDLKPGQKVIIQGQKHLGLKASFLAYILPFIMVFTTLFCCYSITHNEVTSGLASLAILIPYFLVIKVFSKKLQKTFSFRLKEILK